MEDTGYVWNIDKYERTKQKHGVEFHEVVSAMEDPRGYEEPDMESEEERWIWVGRTAQGRVLLIVFTDEELPLYRIITAFDAEGKWLDDYQASQRD